MSIYDKVFYANQQEGSLRSAKEILPIVIAALHPTSIVDVGCGIGTWLSVAKMLGVVDLRGYEGEWVAGQRLADETLSILSVDLENKVAQDRRFDLAMCLEVAEHLSEGRSESLVDDLCSFSDHVLFGAATPGQVGVNHVNLQWQSYWADIFLKRGFQPFDVVRPEVWINSNVECWYKQNILLYSKHPEFLPHGLQPAKMIDLIHPEIFRWQSGVRISAANLFAGIVRIALGNRIHRQTNVF